MAALNNFPFPGFSEFRFAERRGLAELGIDPHSALNWALGSDAPYKVRLETGGLGLATFAVVIGAFWYGASYDPWFLFSFPCFALTFALAGPFTTALGRKIAQPYLLTLGGILVIRYFSGTNTVLDLLALVAVSQLAAAGTFSEMYGVAFRHVKAAALADQARFEEFWNTGAIQIVRADGKGYSNSEVTDVDVGDFPPWRSIARVKRPYSGSQAPSADSR